MILHVLLLRNAGALWRDEANKAWFALMPSLSKILSSLRYDASPIGSVLYFRFWTLFSGSDQGFRLAGVLVGIGIVGAMWWNARVLRFGAPLLSLLLFGLNPVAVRYGDSVTSYGMGTLFSLVLFGCLARLLERTSAGNVIGAIVSAVLCVQCLYQTSIVVAALCLAGALTALVRRRRDSAGLAPAAWILGAGTIAALSLLPFLSAVKYAGEWRAVQQPFAHVTGGALWKIASAALGAQAHFVVWIWLGLCATGMLASVAYKPSSSASLEDRTTLVTFAGFSLVFGIAGYAIFLHTIDLPTQVWYYLLIMGVSALCLDAVFAPLAEKPGFRVAGVALAILVILPSVPGTWRAVHERATNVDLVASALTRYAAKDDLIVVSPWFMGVSFNRAYRGQTPWMQLPPLEDRSIHRYDLLKLKMMMDDPLRPLLQAVGGTLSAGNRVWVVGDFAPPPPGKVAPWIPPAPSAVAGWASDIYTGIWTLQVGSFIASHAIAGQRWPIESPNPVSRFEDLPVFVVSGWRP